MTITKTNGSESESEYDNEESITSESNFGPNLEDLLTSSDGKNIPDILISLKKSIDTQSKVLMKLIEKLNPN